MNKYELKPDQKYYPVPNYSMKCRIYPNETQKKMIDDILHGCHVFCNMVFYDVQHEFKFTTEKIDKKTGEKVHWLKISDAKTKASLDEYRKQNEYISSVPASALSNMKQSVLNDVAKAYDKPVEKIKHKYYSRKHPRNSYTCQEALSKINGTENHNVFIFNASKIGKIKVRGWNQKLRFGNSQTMNFVEFAKENPTMKMFVKIIKDNCGDYFAVFAFSYGISKGKETGFMTYVPQKTKTNSEVGVDLGQSDLAITSDGKKYNNPRFANKNRDKASYYNKKMSKAYGWVNEKFRKEFKEDKSISTSNNYDKWKLKLAKLSRKIARQREYYQHNVSNQLVTNNKIIGLESLLVKEMMDRDTLHKKKGTRKKAAVTAYNLSDAAMSQLLAQIKYKADWYDTEILQIGKYERSTGVCPDCGHTLPYKLDTEIREWTCPVCGKHHDRDIAAARTILIKALKMKEKPNAA